MSTPSEGVTLRAMPVVRTKTSQATAESGPRTNPLDARMLEKLVGYNARRASVTVSALFNGRMATHQLKQTEFSVLWLLAHNPGATSRQLCATLDVLPPNLVNLVTKLANRGLIERRPHPHDGRAVGLHLTPPGKTLTNEAEKAVLLLEADVSARLTAREQATLVGLLQKIYL